MRKPHEPPAAAATETSLDLLRRAQAGDNDALNTLIARYLPRVRRWATGRLPAEVRGMADTEDLVQETVAQAFKKIDGFEIRGEGALPAYLRQVLLNQIRQQIRRARRRLPPGESPEYALAALAADGPSPLEAAIGREALARYESALERLRAEDRELIVARVEFGLTHQELADAFGRPSANAARMAVERALARLTEEMARRATSQP